MVLSERARARRQNHYERMRDKVVQVAKDYFRPYHGSTIHREEDDGNQMIEKKKSGGHMPLNAAVMDTWKEGKLQDSRRMFGRVLAELGLSGDREAFAEVYDLFGRYGAGDSDFDTLKETATQAVEDRESAIAELEAEIKDLEKRPEEDRMMGRIVGLRWILETRRAEFARGVDSAKRFEAVERGIDFMTQTLIAWGIGDKDFWADYGLQRIPDKRTVTKEEKYRRRWLCYTRIHEELKRGGSRSCRTRAMKLAAKECEVSQRVMQVVVGDFESGYVSLPDGYATSYETPKKGRRKKCQSYKTEQDAKRKKPGETPA